MLYAISRSPMRFKIVFSIFACLFFLFAFSTGPVGAKESAPAPIAVIAPTTVEFSPVIAGTVVTHTFNLENKGDAVLNVPGIYSE